MKSVTLSFANIPDKESLHALLQEELSLPAYYGRNLDALYECLTETGEDTKIALDLGGMDFDALPEYFQRAVLCMIDACLENPLVEMTFL